MTEQTVIQNLDIYFRQDMPAKDVARHLRLCFVQLSLMIAKFSPESGKVTYVAEMEDPLYTLHELANKLDPDCR